MQYSLSKLDAICSRARVCSGQKSARTSVCWVQRASTGPSELPVFVRLELRLGKWLNDHDRVDQGIIWTSAVPNTQPPKKISETFKSDLRVCWAYEWCQFYDTFFFAFSKAHCISLPFPVLVLYIDSPSHGSSWHWEVAHCTGSISRWSARWAGSVERLDCRTIRFGASAGNNYKRCWPQKVCVCVSACARACVCPCVYASPDLSW